MARQPDIIVVGAGPIGIACGIEASRRGITSLILEKGCLVNSIYHYPPQLVFFSSPQLLELAHIPMIIAGTKPKRMEVLAYYRRLAEFFELDVHAYEKVEEVQVEEDGMYTVRTSKGKAYKTRFVVLATGNYDHPNLIGVPGEDLPKVSHYYKESHPYYRQKVAVVGGQNSAVEASLDLWRHGAEVTLIHRKPSLGEGVKYWLLPDIEARIREGSIRALFDTRVERIEGNHIVVHLADGKTEKIANDFVFILTGYHPDLDFLKRTGVVLDLETLTPLHDPATMETNMPGIYIAGVAAGGRGSKLFIENTRYHAKLILQSIERKLEGGEDSEA